MTDESTKVLNENTKKVEETKAPEAKQTEAPKAAPKKDNSAAGKAAAAGAGFVAGSAFGAGVSAMAADKQAAVVEEPEAVDPVVEDPAPETPAEQYETPAENEVILATDEGVRVAQVSDDQSFAEAFADARAQVGPGGVFEWRGKAYGTYYKEEWDNMTPAEKAEYQSKIDYDDVLGEDRVSSSSYSHHSSSSHDYVNEPNDMDSGYAHNAANNGYTTVQDGNGNYIQVQEVEIDGNDALLVDVDMDGEADAIMVDADGDGNPDIIYGDSDGDGMIDSAIIDMDGDGVADTGAYDANCDGQFTSDEVFSLEQEDPYIETDNMPDYMNDADPGMYTV